MVRNNDAWTISGNKCEFVAVYAERNAEPSEDLARQIRRVQIVFEGVVEIGQLAQTECCIQGRCGGPAKRTESPR
jgi:hypothetical protein